MKFYNNSAHSWLAVNEIIAKWNLLAFENKELGKPLNATEILVLSAFNFKSQGLPLKGVLYNGWHKEIGLTANAIKKALRRLTDKGVLSTEMGKSSKGRNNYLYTLNIDFLQGCKTVLDNCSIKYNDLTEGMPQQQEISSTDSNNSTEDISSTDLDVSSLDLGSNDENVSINKQDQSSPQATLKVPMGYFKDNHKNGQNSLTATLKVPIGYFNKDQSSPTATLKVPTGTHYKNKDIFFMKSKEIKNIFIYKRACEAKLTPAPQSLYALSASMFANEQGYNNLLSATDVSSVTTCLDDLKDNVANLLKGYIGTKGSVKRAKWLASIHPRKGVNLGAYIANEYLSVPFVHAYKKQLAKYENEIKEMLARDNMAIEGARIALARVKSIYGYEYSLHTEIVRILQIFTLLQLLENSPNATLKDAQDDEVYKFIDMFLVPYADKE